MRLLILVTFLLPYCLTNAQKKKGKNVFITKIDTARNVTIYGGTTILKADNNGVTENFIITPYIDTIQFSKNDFPYELRPFKGVWYQPFCAYPLAEKDVVKGALIPNFNSFGLTQQSSGTAVFLIDGKKENFMIWTTPGMQSTQASGAIFNCKKKPSILIFGDLSDKNNWFVVKL